MKIYIIEKSGDNWHGGTILKECFSTYEEAKAEADVLEKEQAPCNCSYHGCDHKYAYYVHEVHIEESNDKEEEHNETQ